MKRFILTLLAIVIVALIAAIALGYVDFNQTREAKLPRIEGGQLPTFDADVAKVEVGTTNKTVEVPKVVTTNETVTVPTVEVKKDGE